MSYLLRTVRDVKPDLLLARIRRGDITNVSFGDLVRLVEARGFREVGGRGSHRVFAHPEAKRHQVRQVADLIRRYGWFLEGER